MFRAGKNRTKHYRPLCCISNQQNVRDVCRIMKAEKRSVLTWCNSASVWFLPLQKLHGQQKSTKLSTDAERCLDN